MKKKLLFVSMLASMLLVGCSQEDAAPNGGNGETEPQFLTVNLVSNSTTTRAGGDQTSGDPNGKATYEEGLEAENQVNTVRFYFFDAEGKPAPVRAVQGENDAPSYVNYMDWTGDGSEQIMPNVEKILTATLIIQTPLGDKEPASIVAVVNPNVAADVNCSLDEKSTSSIYKVTGDYLNYTDKNFVMSNSTYADGKDVTAGECMAVSVAGHIKGTPGEALKKPVDIYVERTVAKVRLTTSLTKVTGKEYYKTKADGTEMYNGKEIFVKFLGWNVTAVSDKANLIKDIDAAKWNAGNLLTTVEPWNWAEYHRSFWAINPSGVAYQYGAFQDGGDDKDHTVDANLFQAQAQTGFAKTNWVYVNENASDFTTGTGAPTIPTKVIIAAQLVDEDGSPLSFVDYGSQRTDIDGLKNIFATNSSLYKEVEEGGTKKRVLIEPSDLQVVTATAAGKADKDTPGRYKSYVMLTDDAKKFKWYASKTSTTLLKTEEANTRLLNLGGAKVWTSGYTYYYFDIQHLGGIKGVVRNHIYDADITALEGIGTPVYDPDEIIYPEKPVPSNDKYIAARIKILSWRVVNNKVQLEW